MNHYPRHIADWRAATWNLTKVQRCIYSDLIDTYYDKEAPLPADIEFLADDLACRTEEERSALTFILRRYFRLDGKYYRHDRCDEEIVAFHHKVEVAQKAGKASGSARAQRKMNGRSNHVGESLEKNGENANGNRTTQYPIPNTHHSSLREDGGGATSSQSAAPPPAEKPEPAKHRPSRKCPPGFTLTGELLAWAAEKVPMLSISDIEVETEKFKDTTFKTTITDWAGAWRNWLRKEQQFREQRGSRPISSYSATLAARDAERKRVLEGLTGESSGTGIKGSFVDVESRVVREDEEPAPTGGD